MLGKYINFTLGRGKNFFGEGYRSFFLSDNAYSYPYFKHQHHGLADQVREPVHA